MLHIYIFILLITTLSPVIASDDNIYCHVGVQNQCTSLMKCTKCHTATRDCQQNNLICTNVSSCDYCQYDCQPSIDHSGGCNCELEDELTCFGMAVSIGYYTTNDTVQLQYEHSLTDEDDIINDSINCTVSDYSSFITINDSILHIDDDIYYYNISNLKPSTDYTCCIITTINMSSTAYSCFNVTTNDNNQDTPNDNSINITSAIRISATEIRINWTNNTIPWQEEMSIMIFCGKSANMITPNNCQTTELCEQEDISTIQLTNHVSLLDQLDPQSGYCIQLHLNNYSSLQTFVEIYENSQIRIQLNGGISCSIWTHTDTYSKLNDITTNLINKLQTACNCEITSEYILNQYFEACKDDDYYVYRCTLIGYKDFNSSQLVGLAKTQLENNYIIITGAEVLVTKVCLADNISQCIDDDTMNAMTVPNANIIDNFGFVLLFIGAGVCFGIIVLLLVSIVVSSVIVYKRRKRRNQVARRNTSQGPQQADVITEYATVVHDHHQLKANITTAVTEDHYDDVLMTNTTTPVTEDHYDILRIDTTAVTEDHYDVMMDDATAVAEDQYDVLKQDLKDNYVHFSEKSSGISYSDDILTSNNPVYRMSEYSVIDDTYCSVT